MLVVLRVHILAESPVVLSPYQRGMECPGRALYARPRWDTARKHTLSLLDLQEVFPSIAIFYLIL